MYMCIYKYIYILYIHICVWGGCIYVYCSSPYLYIVNTKFLMGFLLSLKIRKIRVGHRISRGFKESVRKVWKFQRSTKKEVGFPGVLKKKSSMEYPWLLLFDFGISRGSHTIFQNFHR